MRGRVVVGVASGGNVFYKIYDQRLGGGFWLWILLWAWEGWSRIFCWDCCAVKRIDAMSIFLLPVVVHAEEKKEEERLW